MEEKKGINFKEMWQNPRGKSIIKLVVGTGIMLLMLIVMAISSRINPETPNEDETEIKTVSPTEFEILKEDLLQNNYAFTYNITINNQHYLYKGNRKENETIGSFTTQGVETNYYIVDNTYYQVNEFDTEEFPNIYENIETNLIDLEYIYNNCRKTPTITNYDNLKKINYPEEELNITFTINKDQIIKILIETNNGTYSLEYVSINKIIEIKSPLIQ